MMNEALRDQLNGLALAMTLLGIIVPLIMLIPGQEHMVGILPYALPVLAVGIALFLYTRPKKSQPDASGADQTEAP